MVLRGLFQLCKNYCLNCNIHGMRYLAEPGRHWSERLFWSICCIFSWWASVYLILQSWHDFTGNSAVSFNTETESIRWNTPFIAVSVCEFSNSKANTNEYFRNWMNSTLGKDDPRVLRQIMFFLQLRYFDGWAQTIRQLCEKKTKKLDCPTTSDLIRQITWMGRLNCSQIFTRCTWRDEEFDCCKYFQPLHTEFGICYTINSIHTRGPRLNMISNVTTGPGTLSIEMKVTTKVFTHSPDDVPDVGADETLFNDITQKEQTQVVGVSITETVNDPSVREATLEQRQCRFSDENPLNMYDKYSFKGCIVECRKRHHMRECNCTSHLMPHVKPEEACDMAGILCLTEKLDGMSWRVMKPEWDVDGEGYYCPCLLHCETMDIRQVYSYPRSSKSYGMEVSLIQLPTERFQRVMVRTLLDLVVNIGGTLGLLMGASLLSLVEVIHFFVLPVGRALVSRWCGVEDGSCCAGPPGALVPPPPPSQVLLGPLRRTRSAARALGPAPLPTGPMPSPGAAGGAAMRAGGKLLAMPSVLKKEPYYQSHHLPTRPLILNATSRM